LELLDIPAMGAVGPGSVHVQAERFHQSSTRGGLVSSSSSSISHFA
jgi:hypothetical protein